MQKKITRRNFLKLTGSTLVATAGSYGLANYLHDVLWPVQAKVAGLADLPPAQICGPPQSIDALLVDIANAQGPEPNLTFAGTDGWISIPPAAGMAPFHPDPAAPDPFNTYIFGFTNLTGIQSGEIESQKMQSLYPAPMFWFKQDQEFRVRLTNLGLAQRPDLVDEHTIHFHGRKNVIPFFDGEPTTSIAVPIGRFFTYVFKTSNPGTYMYHCHVEEVEHVHLGMTGMVFVTPLQNEQNRTDLYPSGKFAYNCGDGSTGYDREFPLLLTEVWAEAHWDFAHTQLPEWSDYKPDYYLLNGRVYPDTLAPNAFVDPANQPRNGNGTDTVPPAGRPDLKHQPYSSLVTCNEGERVLLRFANLGFEPQTMSLAGIKMRVVGKDATLLRNRADENLSYMTDTISIGAGESYDVIFEAPDYIGPGSYNTYLLYNRNYNSGQKTEIRVYPGSNPLDPQTEPNT